MRVNLSSSKVLMKKRLVVMRLKYQKKNRVGVDVSNILMSMLMLLHSTNNQKQLHKQTVVELSYKKDCCDLM